MSFWTDSFWTSNFWTSNFWSVAAASSPELAACSQATGSLLATHSPAVDTVTFESRVYTDVGQSFQADGEVLTGICFRMLRTGTPTGTIRAQVFASTGSAGSYTRTGTALATGPARDVSSLTTSAAYYFLPISYAFPDDSVYIITADFSSLTDDASNTIEFVAEALSGDFNLTLGTGSSAADFGYRVYGVDGSGAGLLGSSDVTDLLAVAY